MKTLDIPHKPKRDHRTVKRFVADSEHTRVCADKGTMRKVSARQTRRIEQLLKCDYKAANRYLKLLVPLESHEHQGVGSSRAVVPNWLVATQKWVADPFSMGRQTPTGKKKSSEK